LKLNPDSLTRHLEQQLLPVYLVSGDEPLLHDEAADALRARARERGFTEREVLFLDRSGDWEGVRAAVSTLSLFATRRIVEVRLPSGKPGVVGARTLASVIASAGDDTLLLILTGRLDRDAQGSDWVRAADARGAWITVWPLPADRMQGWLESRSRRLGLSLEAQAVELLAERTQGNLLAARQELEKLRLLGYTGPIGPTQVLASTADSARFDVAELTEALLNGDGARALRVLAGLRAEGVELPLVLWAVVRALHGLWAAHAGTEETGSRGFPRSAAPPAGARRRAARLPFARLTARAVRADGMAKGRVPGNAWDELALLAADLSGQPALS
jgi:DNA polymerase-3 subunit delta